MTLFFAEALEDGDPLAEPAAAAVPLAGVTGVIVGPLPVLLPVLGAPSVADGITGTVGVADGAPPRFSRPSQCGLRQMITAMPQAVTSKSIAMNARSRCLVDGPRGRTTMVGVLPRRAFTGRSGMRIVICGPPRGCTGMGCGVAG